MDSENPSKLGAHHGQHGAQQALSVGGERMVSLLVGPERTKFLCNASLLSRYSPFFASLLSDRWTAAAGSSSGCSGDGEKGVALVASAKKAFPVSALAPIPPFSRAHTRRPQHLLPSLIASSCPPPYLAPYPTNEPWQNFVLGQGGSPELVNPYVVQSGDGRVAWGIPARNAQPAYIIQAFITNLMLSTLQGLPPHQVSAYDDLSVTLSFRPPSAAPSAPPALVVPLVRGSPYLTFIFPQGGPPATPVLKTIHAILSVEARGDSKYRVALNNGQTWLVYLSSPLALRQDGSSIVAGAPFTGTMRIALLPGNSPQREEALLDAHVATVPVGGRARVGAFRIKLSWRTQQWRKLAPGGTKTPLLMLSLP
ncbi:unnamed protein product, partial [Closterium sp. Naga37s-1]